MDERDDWCESCNQRKRVRWFLWDKNAEVLLCRKCAKELKDAKVADIERI